MAIQIQLRELLFNAFEDLQRSEENDMLAESLTKASSFAPPTQSSRISVITADSPLTRAFLLMCLLEASALKRNRKTLVITAGRNAPSQLGHGLLSMTIPDASFRAGTLAVGDWSKISAHIQLILAADVSIIIRGRRRTTTFITQVEEALRSTGADVLIIDQPRLCFPRLKSRMETGRTELPASIVALSKMQPLKIIALDT